MQQVLIDKLIAEFPLGVESDHGPIHWKRVEAYGLYLADSTGADKRIVSLFAYFHDCCRVDELHDPGHGLRAAEKARELRDMLELEWDDLETLCMACAGHTDLIYSHDPTIATCWDADRLDLDRVGVTPDPQYLSTDEGKRLAMLPAISRRWEAGIAVEMPEI